MKVLNLRCEHGHAFEGWFASEDDFLSQNQRHLIECPMCASALVQKMPSAPRLNFGSKAEPPALLGQNQAGPLQAKEPMAVNAPANTSNEGQLLQAAQTQAAFLKAARQLMENTEDVGKRFAQEARKMHHGEIEGRPIRGQASLSEAKELLDEGIDVLPLPIPEALKNKLH